MFSLKGAKPNETLDRVPETQPAGVSSLYSTARVTICDASRLDAPRRHRQHLADMRACVTYVVLLTAGVIEVNSATPLELGCCYAMRSRWASE